MTERAPPGSTRAGRAGLFLAGLVLASAFSSLFVAVGFRAELARGFVNLGGHEALFWLAHAFLLVPGLLLMAAAVAPALGDRLLGIWTRLDGRRARLALAVAFAGLVFLLAEAGREKLLLGLPLTGEEHSIAFGAKAVASGRLTVPAIEPVEAFSFFSIALRDGRLAPLDFPGAIFFGAAILELGLGRWPWSLLVAASGLAFCAAARRLAGPTAPNAGIVAGALWLLSPMVLALSTTTHPHLLARSWVAFAVATYLALALAPCERPPAWRGALLGLFVGLAFLSRPLETGALLAPVGVHLTWLAARNPAWRRAWAAAAGVFAVAAVLFGAFNQGITGRWYGLGRLAVPAAERVLHDVGPRHLLGINFGFNWIMLGIFLLGPLGLAAVALGLRDRRPAVWALAAGVALDLALALFHKDTGIHLVGPIHASEAAVPLLLLALLGIGGAWRERGRLGLAAPTAAALLAAYLVSLAAFDAVHALTLRDQARVQRLPYAAVERAGIHHAAVIAEPPYLLWEKRPDLAAVRAWAVLFPPPDPELRDDVVYLEPRVDLATIARWLPDRDVYRMTYHADGEPVRLELLRRGERPR